MQNEDNAFALSPFYMHNLYFIIVFYITALLHDHPTVHLPSILTPFYIDGVLSELSSFCMHNLFYAYLHHYIDSLYFTFKLRITAVLYKYHTLHLPSVLALCYMTTLIATVSKRI